MINIKDIDFENMSYAEGLALVATQRPLEKQALNLDAIKKSVGDVLSNPYTQYGLVGAGVGGLGGLASSFLKKKRRRNYLRDAVTGATLGGIGGLAVRGGQDALSGLGDYSSATDTLTKNKIQKKNLDPSVWQAIKNVAGASGTRFMADIGFPQEITPGGPLAESSAEFAKRTGSSFIDPWWTLGAGAAGIGGRAAITQGLQTKKINRLVFDALEDSLGGVAAKKIVNQAREAGFVPKNLGLFGRFGSGKNWLNNILGRPSARFNVEAGAMPIGPKGVPQYKPNAVPNNADAWQKFIKGVMNPKGAAQGFWTNLGKGGLRVGRRGLGIGAAALGPMAVAHALQTGTSGYSGDLSMAQLQQILSPEKFKELLNTK